jgi:PAS domain S-box-containing protein
MTSAGSSPLPAPRIGELDPALGIELLALGLTAVARIDAAGRLLWANPACAALLGLDARALGKPLAALLGLDAADAVALQQALAAPAGAAELARRTDGRPVDRLAIEARALTDGSHGLTLSSVAQHRAEAEAAERGAELLDLAREIGRLGVFERDLRTGRATWDAQILRMWGLPGSGEAPSVDDALRRVVRADREGFDRAFRASLAQAGTYAHHYRVEGADGVLRHLHSQWVVKNGADGRPERVLGLVMDDTHSWTLTRWHDETVAQLALAVDLAGITIWRHDLATDRMHYNEQVRVLLQIEPRPEGVPLAEIRALIHPDDLPRVRASVDAALTSDRPNDTEARYRRADGEWRSVMMRRVVQRDADGRPVAFVGVALDVTERIDDSRRALELGRRFELATRAAGIGYWSLEGGDERARWSDQLRRLHGLGADDLVPAMGEWLRTFVHGDDRDEVGQRFADWVASGRSTLEADFRLVGRDGQVRHVMTHSRVEGGGARSLLFGLVIDVTERRSVELALRRASERAALVARGVGLGTWEHDLRDGSDHWDEQMWRLRGLAPRERAPSADERLAMVHPDDRRLARDRLERSMREGTSTSYEFRVLLPDGSVRWLASRSTPVRDEQGRVVRRIGVNWDITDNRTAAAVRQEREIAQRESQAKSQFLARMSHELRTPLNAVLGFAQLLLAEDHGGDAAAAARRRRVEHIRAAGAHLLSLIDDVLDLSSLEGGELRITLQPVPLAPLVTATLPLIDALLRERGVALDRAGLDVTPLADPTRLRQVLLNLLGNAAKYNREGGRIALTAAREDGRVVLRVADTGRGMSELQLRHLFEPFNRLGVEREGIEGTGIGLAIVKALVERMGGTVAVDSQVGVGTTFTLSLADAGEAPAAAVAPTASRPIPLAGGTTRGTLLYVEDNPVNAMIIAELVARRADLALHIAADGTSGVDKALELQPDLILLDMQLPDLDGHEVLRRLRAAPATAGIPVIALSANAMPEDIDRALRAGMADYWTKPLDFRAFMNSLETLFGPAP